jgi:hypothetical protein
MTESTAPELPISSALSAYLDAQFTAVRSNILASQVDNLAQNIDALFAIMHEVVAAVAAVEARLPK